jgi:hypothetical protein
VIHRHFSGRTTTFIYVLVDFLFCYDVCSSSVIDLHFRRSFLFSLLLMWTRPDSLKHLEEEVEPCPRISECLSLEYVFLDYYVDIQDIETLCSVL